VPFSPFSFLRPSAVAVGNKFRTQISCAYYSTQRAKSRNEWHEHALITYLAVIATSISLRGQGEISHQLACQLPSFGNAVSAKGRMVNLKK
jgi:hypothetical protein